MKEEILEDIGLSKNEAKIYLSLLELGSATATEIAKLSKVYRTNVYDTLQSLIKKGIVAYILKNNKKYFEATKPENLMNIIKERENKLKEILPQLKLSKKPIKSEEGAQVSEGINAFMDILYEFLEYKEPIFVFGIPKNAPELLKTKIPHFHKERIKKKIVMKSIYNYDAQERIKSYKALPCSNAGYIDDNFKSAVSTNICGPEVVLVLWKKPLYIVRIKNENISKAYKNYFKLLWKSIK